jgi:GAF domain-containing protein
MNLYLRLASMPLRIKLVIGLMVGALATIALPIFAIAQYSQTGTPALHTLVEAVTRDRLDTLNLVINSASNITARLSNDPENIAYYANLTVNSADTESRRSVETAFRLTLNEQPTFAHIKLVGLNGRVLVSVPPQEDIDETQSSFYRDLKDHLPDKPSYEVYVGDLNDPDDRFMDFVGIPVTANRPIAYILVEVDPTGNADPQAASIYKAIKSVDSSLGAMTFYLISSKGSIVSSSPDQPLQLNAAMMESQAALTNANNKTSFDYTSPFSGRPVSGVGFPVGQAGITLVGEILTTPFGVSNESRQFLLPLLGLLFVSILCISAASFFVITTIVSPVEYLLDIANQAVQGRVLDDHDPIQQRDELGRLYEAFLAITRRLRYDIQALEDRISRRTHDIEATRDIGQALSSIREQDALMTTVVSLIREHFPEIDYAQVYLVDQRQLFAVLRVSAIEEGKARLISNQQLSLDESSAIADAVRRAQPVVTLDTQKRPGELVSGARSALALPLSTAGVVIGVLDLQSKQVDTFSEASIRLYQAIADQLSIAVNNAMLFEESQSRLNEIEMLNRQLIGEGWREFTTTGRGALLGASTNSSDPNQWTELQRRAIQTGDISEQVSDETVTFALPVSLRGQVIGAVEWDIPRSLYNEDARQLARELSSRLAISADNARLFRQAQRTAQRERLVNEISGKLTQQSNVAEILRVAVKEVGQALRVPQTSIRLATSPDETEQQINEPEK